jgi:hypothetical protein
MPNPFLITDILYDLFQTAEIRLKHGISHRPVDRIRQIGLVMNGVAHKVCFDERVQQNATYDGETGHDHRHIDDLSGGKLPEHDPISFYMYLPEQAVRGRYKTCLKPASPRNRSHDKDVTPIAA